MALATVSIAIRSQIIAKITTSLPEKSLKWNRSDFNNFRIRPRFLRDVSIRDMTVNVFSSSVSFPCGISPTAMQKMAHVDGEIATAKGNFFLFQDFFMQTFLIF